MSVRRSSALHCEQQSANRTPLRTRSSQRHLVGFCKARRPGALYRGSWRWPACVSTRSRASQGGRRRQRQRVAAPPNREPRAPWLDDLRYAPGPTLHAENAAPWESRARFLALQEVRLATKCNASSSQTASTGTRCGRPLERTVASQYVSASARRLRASAHDVDLTSAARYGCAITGSSSGRFMISPLLWM